MIEKLNFREVENGAHGGQSTVVEGASLISLAEAARDVKDNFEILLAVFMPNTPWNHAITYTYVAQRSMIEMEHSDCYLRTIISSPETQMDRSRHALFFFGLIVSNCVTSSKKVSKVKWKKFGRAEIGARKYVLGQQRKSTNNERESEFASPEINY